MSPGPAMPKKLTGGSSDYYKVRIAKPVSGGLPYQAECLDIIEALGMNFHEGNVFKAIWRIAAARQGNGKPGTTALYDAEKIEFFGKRLVVLFADLYGETGADDETRPAVPAWLSNEQVP